jgi:hypothetical protein
MSEKQTFRAKLEKHDASEATVIKIPFDVERVFGAKRVPVSGNVNGAKFRSTIFRMDGRYLLIVNKQLREAANVKSGDITTVELERDTEPRIVEPPADLAAALKEDPSANEVWEKLSYTHRKEFVLAIEEAKKPETRARRVEKTIDELLNKYAGRANRQS